MAPRVARVTEIRTSVRCSPDQRSGSAPALEAETPRDEALESARWDLDPLLEGESTDGLLDQASERSKAFAERYRGALGELDVGGLAEAMNELAAISGLAGRAGSYASLSFSLDTEDPDRG